MKNFKFLYLLLAVVGVVTFTSCQDEKWAPGAPDATIGVYFPAAGDVTLNVEATDTEAVVKVARNNTAEAANVVVRAAMVAEQNVFSLNGVAFEAVEGGAEGEYAVRTTIDFAAGQAEADLVISFDGSKLVAGQYAVMNLVIDAAYASMYGVSAINCTIGVAEPWEDWGTGYYVDDFLNILPEVEAGYFAPVQFQKHAENANRIRVVNPFSAKTIGLMWGGVPGYLVYQEGAPDHYLEFDITDPNNVITEYFYELPFGINFGEDGILQAYMLIDTNEDGSAMVPLVLENGIIKFPVDSVALVYPYNGKLGGWYVNPTGLMQYYLPGTEMTDYTIIPEYAGMLVSADNTSAKAIVNFTLGADVEGYKFTVIPGALEDVTAVAASIVDGTAEQIVSATAEETQFEIDLTTGTYTVVAVPYAGEEAVGSAGSSFFFFPGIGGGEKPEVAADFVVNSLAAIFSNDPDRAAAMEANYPAEYFVGIGLFIDNPAEITGMRFFYDDATAVHAAVESGDYTYESLVDGEYGMDTYAWIEKINEGNIRILNLPAGSNNCYIFAIDTIYGTTQYYHVDYAMPAYSGGFAVGQYVMTDGDYSATVSFNPGKNAGTLFVSFADLPGFDFYAAFDKAAQTLSLDGSAYGYESYGSIYNVGLTNDDGSMLVLAAAADDTFAAAADSWNLKLTDNVPTTLENGLVLTLLDAEGTPINTIFKLSTATVIAPAATAQSVSAKSEFKSVMVESETAMIEMSKSYSIKAYNGNFERQFELTSKPAQIF